MSNVVPIKAPQSEPFASILMRCTPLSKGPTRIQPVLGIVVNMDLFAVTFLASVLAAYRSFRDKLPEVEVVNTVIRNRFARVVTGSRDKDGLEFLRQLEHSPVTYSSEVHPLIALPDDAGSLIVSEDGFYWIVSVGLEGYKSEELTLHSIQLAMSVDHAR